MKVRASVVGGILGLILSIGLLVTLLVQQEPFPVLLLLPALLGCGAAMIWDDRPWVPAAAAVGVTFSGMMFAIGGMGLLYLPSLLLLLIGVAQASRQRTTVSRV